MVLKALKNLLGAKSQKADLPSVPAGERYYVVGDIHGRCDLFEALADAVDADDRASGPANTTIVLLGDLVDRGADSAGVIRRAREWQRARKVRILAGNHEEMFLESFDDEEVLRHFLKHGGRETVLSYGIPLADYNRLSVSELLTQLPSIIPQEDRDFLDGFEEKIIAGDYLFVHAGINPKRPIEEQTRKDMLWIRDRFLSYEGPLPKVVVHGHTIFDDVEDRGIRIGIDTGAFRSGVLTALVLEDDTRRTIKAVDKDTSIAIVHEELTT
ncbi:MAG: metallophosphoesterase family protein [Marinomonas sp.]